MFKCLHCGKEVDLGLNSSKKIQCSFCGYRILIKIRPSVTKKIEAK
ncbi:MAG: DNA-directed RNA polymerase subunit P [Candidatus Aenigmatarchaeota archaeon]|nr:DNA-directed RNA polymerase subunit P [Nanoarchaeota archaeon]